MNPDTHSTGGAPEAASGRNTWNVAAVDLGAGSGRVVLGSWDGGNLTATEVARFPGGPRAGVGNTLTWDLTALLDGVQCGLRQAREAAGAPLDALAVDTWGVDYGLLGGDGKLLGDPRCYRDPRASRHLAEHDAAAPAEETFGRTGVEPNAITTSAQLFADLREDPGLRGRIGAVVLLPDLFHHLLGAPVSASQTIASTTALAQAGGAGWDSELMSRLGIDPAWFPPIEPEGTIAGIAAGPRARAAGVEGARIIRAGTHDTAAAVHALVLGGLDDHAAFLSCGSWSLVGVRAARPATGPDALAAGLTNEAGVDGRPLVMRNLTGLWLLQQAQGEWGIGIGELVERAHRAPAGTAIIDTTDPELAQVGDMVGRLTALVRRECGATVTEPGHLVRIVLESLAHSYSEALDRLAAATRWQPTSLTMAGGGVRNTLLCQLTANATGLSVAAGPAEATALGNLATQLLTLGVDSQALAAALSRPVQVG